MTGRVRGEGNINVNTAVFRRWVVAGVLEFV